MARVVWQATATVSDAKIDIILWSNETFTFYVIPGAEGLPLPKELDPTISRLLAIKSPTENVEVVSAIWGEFANSTVKPEEPVANDPSIQMMLDVTNQVTELTKGVVLPEYVQLFRDAVIQQPEKLREWLLWESLTSTMNLWNHFKQAADRGEFKPNDGN